MRANFGFNYHNSADNKNGRGVMIKNYYRVIQDGQHAIMGSDYTIKWISQGTYWHLLNEFRSKPNPELLTIRGYIARDNAGTAGFQLPVYKVMGIADLEAQQEEQKNGWQIILRDAAGKQLNRYAIHARWHVPDLDVKRKILSYTYRIPFSKRIGQVELHGPDGLLDKKIMSATDPVVRFDPVPVDGIKLLKNKQLTIKWKGSDKDGDKLSYSLLFFSRLLVP